jgi:hypothetical protein
MYNILYVDDSKIKYKNKLYNVNIAFNRTLKAIDILEDKDLDDIEKGIHAFECFFDSKNNFSASEKIEVVNKILENINSFASKKKTQNEKEVMNIKQDFEYIYSSFWKDYGIDLIEQFDKLSWIKFLSLLNGLSKDTKMAEVIKIRSMEVPEVTKNNAKERQEIMKLKAYYQLEGKEEEFQDQLNSLFGVLQKVAKKKPKKKKKR